MKDRQMTTRKPTPVPTLVSQPVAARLLAFDPPSGFGRHLKAHPELFPTSTQRLFSIVDIENHPRRAGRPVTAAEYLRIDCALADDRAVWRDRNARRKAGTLVAGRGKWQQAKPKAPTNV